jgi:hypothetical protein
VNSVNEFDREPLQGFPNFWHDPFEVYVQEHIKRAWKILTYNEYAYVDDVTVKLYERWPRGSYEDCSYLSHLAGEIHMGTLLNGDVIIRMSDGSLIQIVL